MYLLDVCVMCTIVYVCCKRSLTLGEAPRLWFRCFFHYAHATYHTVGSRGCFLKRQSPWLTKAFGVKTFEVSTLPCVFCPFDLLPFICWCNSGPVQRHVYVRPLGWQELSLPPPPPPSPCPSLWPLSPSCYIIMMYPPRCTAAYTCCSHAVTSSEVWHHLYCHGVVFVHRAQ